VASTARRRRAPARAPGRTGMRPAARGTDECMHVHASRLSDALTLDEQRTHACYAGRARGASAALPLGRSAACRWNHPKRPAEELTQTERWCPLSVAWKRAACSAACSRGARWVEAAGGTPRTSRECACITWCSFSAGATNADTNAAPSPQRTRIVAERERVGFTRSHAYHRQAERARELCGAAAAAADRLLTSRRVGRLRRPRLVPSPRTPLPRTHARIAQRLFHAAVWRPGPAPATAVGGSLR